jgi:hypothetical protein
MVVKIPERLEYNQIHTYTYFQVPPRGGLLAEQNSLMVLQGPGCKDWPNSQRNCLGESGERELYCICYVLGKSNIAKEDNIKVD